MSRGELVLSDEKAMHQRPETKGCPFARRTGRAIVVLCSLLPALPPAGATEERPEQEQGTIIEGQVFDPLGAGVKGAEVVATQPAEGGDQEKALATTTTNETGDFKLVIPGQVSGEVLVSISKEGYAPAEREIEIDPQDEFPPFVDVELAGAIVTAGVVRDFRSDEPVAGATIRLQQSFRTQTAESGPDGKFEVEGLLPGRSVMIVEAEGFAREKQEVLVVIVTDEPDTVEEPVHLYVVKLKPERIVHLLTTDEQGQPVGGVIVECLDESRRDFRSLATDADGKLTIRGLHYDTHLLALRLTHEQYVSSGDFDRRIELPADAVESTHKLVLEQAGAVSGTVTDQSRRQPLNGARVIVGELYGDRTRRDWTGFDGKYRVNGVPPGRQVVTVHLRGYAPELATVEVEVGKTAMLDFKLGPGGQVGGLVVGPEGKPLAGVHVVAVRWREHETLGLQAMTDGQGRFVIADAPNDEFHITLLHSAHQAVHSRPVRAPKTDYRFEMIPRGGLQGGLPGTKLKIGDDAPAFRLTTLQDETLSLADLKGKTVLLDFWAIWCIPCVAEIPNLQAVHTAFGQRKDFVMISISLDRDQKTLRKFIKDRKLDWRHAVGEKSGAAEASGAYGVSAIPASFLIGPDSKIRAIDLYGPGMKGRIEKTLAAFEAG